MIFSDDRPIGRSKIFFVVDDAHEGAVAWRTHLPEVGSSSFLSIETPMVRFHSGGSRALRALDPPSLRSDAMAQEYA